MKKLTLRLTSTLILAAFALMQILPQGTLYAQNRDTGDAVSERTFFERAAGWLKQTEYKKITEDAVRDRNATFTDTSFINGKTLTERPEAEVELQRMTSGGEDENTFNAFGIGAENTGVIDAPYDDPSLHHDVAIGTGQNKEYDQTGRLLSERINGRVYRYVGFDNVGTDTIYEAVRAAGAWDAIIVKGGKEYSGFSIYSTEMYGSLSLYGGYREDGKRDLFGTPTVINGGVLIWRVRKSVEINGFKITGRVSAYNCTRSITIKNNDITNAIDAIHIQNSTAYVTHNKIEGSSYYNSGIIARDATVIVTENDISNMGYGISAYEQSTVTARNNNISVSRTGIYASGNSTITLTNNDISGGKDHGITTYNSQVYATNNNISGGSSGINASRSIVTITNNMISGQLVGIGASSSYINATKNSIKGGYRGIYATSNSNITVTDNDIYGGSENGIHLWYSHLTATNNNISAGKRGMYVYRSRATVTNNNISGDRDGLYSCDSDLTVTDNNLNSIYVGYNTAIIASGNYVEEKKWRFTEDLTLKDNPYVVAPNIIDGTGNELKLTEGIGRIIASTPTTPTAQIPTPIVFRRERRRPIDMLRGLIANLRPSILRDNMRLTGPTLAPMVDTLDMDLQEWGLQPDLAFTDHVMLKTEGELARSAQESLASSMPIEMLNQKMLNMDYTEEGVATDLEEKEEQALAEENILKAAKVVLEETEYLDEEILQDFTEELERTLWAIIEADSLKLEGISLTVVPDALSEFAEENMKNYSTYTVERDAIYKRIETLLVRVEKEILPDDFLAINTKDASERRKLEMDHKLENLTGEDLAFLTQEERSDLIKERMALQALHATYLNVLTEKMVNFIRIAKENLKGMEPYSIFRPEEKDKLKVR